MISWLTILSWQIKRTILHQDIKTTRQLITKVGIVLAQVTLQFTWEMHLVLNLHQLYFLVDPFVVNNQGLSAVPSCELSRLLENLELRYAFNTLAAVTPDRTPYTKWRNAFGVNRRETFWRTLCWDTDFEGIDKQDLAVKLCLIFLCATMTSLTRAKTEYILTYRVFLFILKRSV